MTKVLFVCLGNICRSPTADGVFQKKVLERGLQDRIFVDSAGTGDWHIGYQPDKRATAAAQARGYDLTELRARQVETADFAEFDYLLAMDSSNYRDLQALSPAQHRTKIKLFLEFAPQLGLRIVPDPYYGEGEGFEQVLDMVEEAADGLLNHLESRLA